MKQKYNGFTLIELMVSVALMLIIIGMTMVIFNSTSTTFTVAEAKVDIMQNARLALDTIAKDMANATAISNNMITTITSYVVIDRATNNPITLTGRAQISYQISPTNNQLFSLNRQIFPMDLDTTRYTIPNNLAHELTSTLAEFLIRPNIPGNESTNALRDEPLYFEFFRHSGNINTNWERAEENAVLPNYGTEFPPLVRVTITITDEFRTACRTLSRMIWIPKGIRRTAL